MKILLISDNYPPENNALSNRAYANSRYLSKHHDVSVLTCFPRPRNISKFDLFIFHKSAYLRVAFSNFSYPTFIQGPKIIPCPTSSRDFVVV